MKKFTLIASSLAVAFSLANAKEVVIGVVLPMTGAAATYGQTAWQGVELANKMQPTLANGDSVKVVLVDSKSDKVETATGATRLIDQDKAVALIGEMITGNTQQILQIADAKKIPAVAPAATADKLLDTVKFGSRVTFQDSIQGEVAADFATKSNLKNAVVVADQTTAYSLGLAKAFEKKFTANGGNVVKKLNISSGDKDFKAVASQIATLNPEFVYIPFYYTEAALLVRQAKQIGVNAVFVGSDGIGNQTYIDLGGEAVNGTIFTDVFDYTKPETKLSEDFVNEFEKANGNREVAGFTALGADTYFILVNALNKCEDQSGECINNALHSTQNFEGVSGTISLDEKGNATRSVVLKVIENQKPVYKDTIIPSK